MTTSSTDSVKHTPWQVRIAMTLQDGEPLYTISRVVNRKRVHLEYASNGKPMLYGAASARAKVTDGSNRIDAACDVCSTCPAGVCRRKATGEQS